MDVLNQTHDHFVERIGFLGELFGFSKILGQIYSVLYLSPDPLSINEIMKKLHISKASVSTNIRELEKWGGCKKVWVKGDRKDYYEAETNLKSFVNKRLMDALKRRINVINEISTNAKGNLNDHKDSFSKEELKTYKFYQSRIDKFEKIRKNLDLILNTLSKVI